MPKKSKNIYSKYSKEALEKAVASIRRGELSFGKASIAYQVPKATLVDHVNGKISPGARPGKKPAIPLHIENGIASKIISASEKGFGLSKQQLVVKISRLCTTLKLKTPFKNKIPGDDWWRGFKSRHPELVLRKPEKLSTTRSRMMNRVVVSNYFIKLGEIIAENNLTPDRVWNCDETGKQFEHNPVTVVARKGARAIPGRTGNSRENVTILATVNAAGSKMPPLCIIKGKTVRALESFSTLDAPTGTVWAYQQKAWMCDILGTLWFRDVFLKHCGPSRPQLLVLDSHGSHEVLELLEEAVKENIIILAMPPHTSHHLQPLDKSVFGPFSKAYNRACSDFMADHPDHLINKTTWPRIFKTAWDKAVTSENIKSGFRATGIWPLNPSAVPAHAFAPADAFEVPKEPEATTNVPPDTPMSTSLDTSLDVLAEAATAAIADDVMDETGLDTSLDVLAEAATAAIADNVIDETAINTIVTLHDPVLDTSLDVLADAASVAIPSDDSVNVMTTTDLEIPDADVPSLLEALGNGNFTLTENNVAATDWSWNADLDNIFCLPTATKKKKTSSTCALTSYRLLTSAEVIEGKRVKMETKLQKEKEKAERKVKQEERKKNKK